MSARPLVVVCEDGHEYVQRFSRFLGEELELVRTDDLASAEEACRRSPRALLFDLDFSRLPPERLIDENGQTGARTRDESRRLAQMQGILILRALRSAGVTVPALLFADLDDPSRVDFLERSLSPLWIVPSSEGMASIKARLFSSDFSSDFGP
jgi:hypothetical protein